METTLSVPRFDRLTKPRPQPYPLPRPLSLRTHKRAAVTLCIAAKCIGQIHWQHDIILCADKRTETDTAGAETGFIFENFGRGWFGLISGTVPDARALANCYRSSFENAEDITPENIAELIEKPAQLQRLKYVDEYTRSKHSLSYVEFRKCGPTKQLTPSMFQETEREVSRINTGCDLIVAGFFEDIPAIYTVDRDAHIAECDHFASLGTGSKNAEAMLSYRNQHKSLPFLRTLYHVYEAKTFAQSAPGVGKLTDMGFVTPDGICRFISNGGLDYLTAFLQGFGPQPTEDLFGRAAFR